MARIKINGVVNIDPNKKTAGVSIANGVTAKTYDLITHTGYLTGATEGIAIGMVAPDTGNWGNNGGGVHVGGVSAIGEANSIVRYMDEATLYVDVPRAPGTMVFINGTAGEEGSLSDSSNALFPKAVGRFIAIDGMGADGLSDVVEFNLCKNFGQ